MRRAGAHLAILALAIAATLTQSAPIVTSPRGHLSAVDDPLPLVVRGTPEVPPRATTGAYPEPFEGSIVALLRRIAIDYGIDPDAFVALARCESGLRPRAVSPSGAYRGLYQQAVAWWPARAARAGFAGASIYDPEANATVAAELITRSGWHHFPACSAVLGLGEDPS